MYQVILRALIRCLGDSKVTVAMATVDTLDLYSDRIGNFRQLLESVARFGVLSDSPAIRRAVLANMDFLFAEKNCNRDFQILVSGLVRLLSDDGCSEIHSKVLRNLDKISRLVGEVRFRSYLDDTLPVHHRERYSKPSTRGKPELKVHSAAFSAAGGSGDLVYGIVPNGIIALLDDRTDIRAQSQAAEEIKRIVISAPDMRDLQPQATNFILHIACLLQERVNFQVLPHFITVSRTIIIFYVFIMFAQMLLCQ